MGAAFLAARIPVENSGLIAVKKIGFGDSQNWAPTQRDHCSVCILTKPQVPPLSLPT